MKKTTIPIKGMHCRSCELIVEEKLKELPGVRQVEVNIKQKMAIIHSSKEMTNDSEIRQKLVEAGYDIGLESQKSWINHDPVVLKDLFYAASFFVVVYLIIRSVGISNISTGSLSSPSNFAIILLIGLAAGFSSCMALVGGLVLGISAKHSENNPQSTSIQKFVPHLYFNLGRIVSYILLGGLIGLVGKAFQFSGSTLGILTILVGFVMLAIGLQLTEVSPRLANFSLSLPSSVGKIFGLGKKDSKYNHLGSMVTGAMTFFLPCGFTQAMQLYAMSTGNFWSGAIVMGLFAIGTAPGLLSIGSLTSFVKGVFAKRFFKFAGLAVVAFSLINISNGLGLAGYSIAWSGENKSPSTSSVPVENGVQIIRMEQCSSGYSPNNFTIKKGIPAKWIINATDAGSCSSSIYSQDLNIQKLLSGGENIIEFTPTKIGKIQFSCSMGMYRGYFNVIENDVSSQAQVSQASQPAQSVSSTYPGDQQVIKATYSYYQDIQPKDFTVEVNKPVRFEIEASDDGYGCMGSVALPGLSNDYYTFQKGKTIVFNFTPTKMGQYYITCSMGTHRGTINVK